VVNGGGFTNQLASIVQNSVQLTFNVGAQTSALDSQFDAGAGR